MSLDIERLKEDAIPEEVAEAIEMDIQYMKRRTSILCPAHNDHNHGSCYLTDDGYICYSCNHRGDVIDMVQKVKKVGFLEACRLIADLYGGIEEYESGEQSVRQLRVPANDECRSIGIRNQPVYVPIGETDSDAASYNRGLFRTELILDSLSEERPRYRIYQMVANNPLRALRRLDEDRYLELLRHHCARTVRELSRLLQVLQDPAAANSPTESRARTEALSAMPLDQAVIAVQQLIVNTREIAARYTGNGLADVGAQTKDTSLLTMVSTVNASFLQRDDIPF